MSFGFSLSDLIALVSLAKKTYDGWQGAPKEYEDVVQTVQQGEALISHVHRRFDALFATETQLVKEVAIADSLRGCNAALKDLHDVAKRRRKLGHWDRFKLGTSKINQAKSRLARHIGMTTPLLFLLELESIGKDTSLLPAMLERIPEIIAHALPIALGQMIDARSEDVGSVRSSAMTTYGDDDRQAWRELRRQLISCGIKDSTIRQQRERLVRFAKSLVTDATCEAEISIQRPPITIVDAGPAPGDIGNSSRDLPSDDCKTEACDDVARSPVQIPTASIDQRCSYQASCETDHDDEDGDKICAKGSVDGPLLEPSDGFEALISHAEGDMPPPVSIRQKQASPPHPTSPHGLSAVHSGFKQSNEQFSPTFEVSTANQAVAKDKTSNEDQKHPKQFEIDDNDDSSNEWSGSDVAYRNGLRSKRGRPLTTKECSDAGKDWLMHNWVYKAQSEWSDSDDSCSDNSVWSSITPKEGAEDDMSTHAQDGHSDGESPRGSRSYRPPRSANTKYDPRSDEAQRVHFSDDYPRPPPRETSFRKIIRRIEYRPLDPQKDGTLLLQFQLPMGMFLRIENGLNGKEPRFRHEFEPEKWSKSFPEIGMAPSVWRVSMMPCWHTFPCDPLMLRENENGCLEAYCGCQIIYWTGDMQRLNPSFLGDLRRWIGQINGI